MIYCIILTLRLLKDNNSCTLCTKAKKVHKERIGDLLLL